MIKYFIILIIISIGSIGESFSQQLRVDTSSQVLPPLELPEITIVGKKAVTLPFARKGEKYDVSLYQAPLPDSSLIGERQDISFLPASIPDYKERRKQWHVSFDGFAGSIGSAGFRSYVTYDNELWKLDGAAGLSGTKGHVLNSDASAGMIGINAGTLLKTDNPVFRTRSIFLGLQFFHDRYGLFAIIPPAVNRERNTWEGTVSVNSLDRSDNVLDIGIHTLSTSLRDYGGVMNSRVTSFSPEITASFMKSVRSVNITATASYRNSSVDLPNYLGNSSLFLFTTYVEWKLSKEWTARAGGTLGNGSGNNGNSLIFSGAIANAVWSLSKASRWEFWLKPKFGLVSYDENIRQNPYLAREILLLPERAPLNIGTTYSLQTNALTAEMSASFTRFNEKSITIADSGVIRLQYVKANQMTFVVDGATTIMNNLNVSIKTIIQPSFEDGRTVQLPMVPLFKLHARTEYVFDMPFTAWASLDYWSRQHIDRQGTRELASPFIVNSGISSTFIRQTVISFEILNLFNAGYEWWSGYPAPGREFRIQARMNIL